MKTWIYEIFTVGAVLCIVTFISSNDIKNWVVTVAVLLTFNHAQIGDRLQERQAKMDKPTVECYHKLNKLFAAKEITWIIAFILMGGYTAIVGSAMFALYPLWRRYYRKNIKPLQ